ncbi:MAG TPA: discoidin domain-containing protein, partial [Candidatus Sulfotelmatobacter sp.]|nr:discoidin domain-containing protein [Candidatus Sulfotelmatobacter sp.]
MIAAVALAPVAGRSAPRVLDDFESTSAWRAIPADGVQMKLSSEPGPWGHCLRVDFDFQKGGGYAVLHRELDLPLPENYRFAIRLRGATAPQNLEFKLADSTGDNVWWCNRRNFEFPAKWETLVTKRRQIAFAWGPRGGGELRHARAIEFAITAGSGGKGTVWFDELSFEPLARPPATPPRPVATASSGSAGWAVDRLPGTGWTPSSTDRAPWLDLDLGYDREFGGLILTWQAAGPPRNYDVEQADARGAWRIAKSVRGARGLRDYVVLPEREARRLRIALRGGRPSLGEIEVKPVEWAADPNSLVVSMASDAPRGCFPRAFLGEQSYWTIVGAPGARSKVLLGEDGAIEVAHGTFSIEPFLGVETGLRTWADARVTQSLRGGERPIPSVVWALDDLRLEVTAFADGEGDRAPLRVRYRLRNLAARSRVVKLRLALRPYQVNPPAQFLNRAGGV